ncbi:hypothetical protein [Endozoicomonas sp. ALD040]|uniref:hypothetical protein n=1 Tax=unclassified Endozoicomonas TaxID=2644528 RepID=UPI003BAF0C3C
MLLLLLLSVIAQAESLTRGFVVELQQDPGSPNQSFFINSDPLTLSGKPSVITKSYSGSDFPPYDKRQRPDSNRVKTPLIESIFWQWLYATDLLVTYELTRATRGTALSPTPYSWLLIEMAVAVGWFLQSYWNPDSLLFKPFGIHMSFILTLEDHRFVITTMVPGSEQQQQQGQLSQSTGKQAPQASSQPASAFNSPLYSGSADGNGDSQQQSHTLGLNCFVHPCHGVCKFRSLSDHTYSMSAWTACADPIGPPGNKATIPGNLPASANDWIIIQGLLILGQHGTDNENEISSTPAHFTPLMVTSETQQTATETPQWGQRPPGLSRTVTGQATEQSEKLICDLTLCVENGQQRSCGKFYRNAHALSLHKNGYHTGHRTCDVTVVGEDGKERSCGTFCNNAAALTRHKQKEHSGQQICDTTVVRKDGRQRPCGKVCKNAIALSKHKRHIHSGQRTCVIKVVRENGQQQPCGKVCKNVQALLAHKINNHSEQKTCDLTVIGEDGQQRPCAKVCKNGQLLLYHKRSLHTGQQTCDLTVIGEHHQPQPCGKVCSSTQALLIHKSRFHTRQRTCQVKIVGEDGQSRPCATLCKGIGALSDHKRRDHTGKLTCNVILVPEDGQPQQCGKVCISAKALSNHKRTHRKRKPVGGNQDVEIIAPKGKANR